MSDKTFWQYCGRGNGKQALIDNFVPSGKVTWDDENSDPLQDIRDYLERRRNELWQRLP